MSLLQDVGLGNEHPGHSKEGNQQQEDLQPDPVLGTPAQQLTKLGQSQSCCRLCSTGYSSEAYQSDSSQV